MNSKEINSYLKGEFNTFGTLNYTNDQTVMDKFATLKKYTNHTVHSNGPSGPRNAKLNISINRVFGEFQCNTVVLKVNQKTSTRSHFFLFKHPFSDAISRIFL